jgi:Replication-relaxation
VARSRSAHDRTPPLSDLDLHILGLLSSHRVMTQNQLAAVNPQTPSRTLRYRSNRLAKLGLAGRSRPYRERGSAPHHLWPTRKGEAIVTGGPPPRGGERREPNPLFLAHAAGLSQIYVALETTLPPGLALRRFAREGEAREEFEHRWEKRAIAPDILIEVTDEESMPLLGFVELDMGTMSHRQLKKKAEGYATYGEAGAWRDLHPYPPALLFATTTEKRARAFLAAMRRASKPHTSWPTAAGHLGRRLSRFAVEPGWLIDEEDGEALDLIAVLREARRPFDEQRRRREEARRQDDEERRRLRSDPDALRDHLRRRRDREWGLERIDRSAATALQLTIDADDPLNATEREALHAFGAMFEDPLRPSLPDRELGALETVAFAQLVEHHREAQLDRIADLELDLGDGPSLRLARGSIEKGTLLDARALADLEYGASRDEDARRRQEELRAAYLDWREAEARRLAKAQGITGRLRNGPESFLDEIDERALRRCPRCDEIAYPDPKEPEYERGSDPYVASRCHFCDSTDLVQINGPAIARA